MQRITRAQVKGITMAILDKQGGKCAVCKLTIDRNTTGHKSDYCLDHCHETGIIRGVLHRSCNSALGKIDNAAGRWGAKSMKYSAIIPYLRAVVEYYERGNPLGVDLVYPDHKTPEQQKAVQLKKRRETAARTRATKVMKAKGATK